MDKGFSGTIFCSREGCNLIPLTTAEEAMIALCEQKYDIIICDYKLPGMDGVAFFERIRESHPDALKILITAYGNENIVNEANRIGIHDFIQKPLTTNALEESLASLVQQYEDKHGEIIPERNR